MISIRKNLKRLKKSLTNIVTLEEMYHGSGMCSNTQNQPAEESIDQYVTNLKIKAQTCEFENLRDSLIRDHIVCGIICDKTRGRLLRKPNLDLQRATDIIM